MQLDELLDQRQPDAAALVRARAGVLDAVEPLEQAGHLAGGDADAGVGHRDHRVAALRAHGDPDTAVEGELQRVAEQVQDHLLPHAAVEVDRIGQRRAVHREVKAGPVHGGPEDAGKLGRHLRDVGRLVARLHPPGLDPGEVEQGVDQPAQPQPVAADDLELLAHLRAGVGQQPLEFLRGPHDQRQRGAELVADVGEERGLGPVELGQRLRPALLVPEAAGARDASREMPRHQAGERAVAVVKRPVPVQGGHQEPVRGGPLLPQRHDERLDGRLPPRPGGQAGEPAAVEVRQRGLAPQRRRGGPGVIGVADRERGRSGGVPGGDAGACRQPGGGAVAVELDGVEQIGQGEGQVLPIALELPPGELERLPFGADDAGVGAQIAQGGHPALADHALGVLADHAEHADHGGVLVAERAVGEGVVALLRIAGALEEQQQPLVPGRLAGGEHGVDPRADVVPDLLPYLAGRPAERPRVLAPQRVPPVGVVAEERQLRPPRHPHREPGRQQDVDRGLQALRPGPRQPERGGGPVHRGEMTADLLVGGEQPGLAAPWLGICRTHHRPSPPQGPELRSAAHRCQSGG